MRRNRFELFAASFLMLFVELVLIRWAGAYVVYLSYFSNVVLLGSFLGIGLGFLRRDRSPDLFRWWPVLLALLMGAVAAFPVVIDRSGADLVYFGARAERGLPVWVMLPFVFVASAATLAAIAQGVAVRFARFPALTAYRLDVLGSLAGIAAYTVLSLLGTPPIAWALVIAVLAVALRSTRRMLDAVALVAIVAVTIVGTFRGETTWSPYYRVEIRADEDGRGLWTNGIPHQFMSAQADPVSAPYDTPYLRLADTPDRVLIVGAGTGNDVSAALAAGAGHVDAVEIDPVIQRIGATQHPDRPYDDPRVDVTITDGRAFVEHTDARYDLIVFALPDSLTLVSGQSGVRLESFLFTEEAIRAAHDHLAPGGAFTMYNFYREPWLVDRLAGTLSTVFGSRPCWDLWGPEGPLSVAGGIGGFSVLTVGTGAEAVRCATTWDPDGRTVPAPVTDDHPFVYLRTPGIPGRYLLALGVMLAIALVTVRGAGGRIGSMAGSLDLFFMGAAFLLLETKSIVAFALLFGTTWLVNALVFGAILASVLAAIEVGARIRPERRGLVFAVLFASLVVAFVVPPGSLLGLPAVLRFVVAGVIAFLPVFAANIVFAERFRRSEEPTTAFAANLLGAMVGGAIEYVALWSGYRILLIVVAALYLLAWVTSRGPLRRAQVVHA